MLNLKKKCLVQNNLSHHMFTIEPQSLDFLQAQFVHIAQRMAVKSYIL